MSSAAPLADASEPRIIARKYRLDVLLGEGGMGSVWRAINLQLEAPVAIKLLRSGLDAQELGERLRVEARAAAKLVHPNIVRVFDVGEAETGEPFIVMELLDGESMRDILQRGPLPAVSAVQLLLPVAEALSLAHSRGVVHRDIKPDNIFIANVGDTLQPKLLDFGIAKITSSAAVRGASLTSTGTVLGSPEYMSPEQALGRVDVDYRTDVWSFCALQYEALSGRTPFSGDTAHKILLAVVQDAVVPLTAFGVDAGLSAIVQRGLSKSPEARQQSMFELGQELATWLYRHGTSEDATGTGLEYKWLGRSLEATPVTRAGRPAPRAKHDEATLVSVLPPCTAGPGARVSPRGLSVRHKTARRRAWLAAASVLGVAFWGCAAWTVLSESPAAGATTSSRARVEAVAHGVLPAEAPPRPAVSSMETRPLATTTGRPATSIVSVRTLPIATSTPPPVRAAATTRAARPPRAVEPPGRGTLPRALPMIAPRPSKRDLLDPY